MKHTILTRGEVLAITFFFLLFSVSVFSQTIHSLPFPKYGNTLVDQFGDGKITWSYKHVSNIYLTDFGGTLIYADRSGKRWRKLRRAYDPELIAYSSAVATDDSLVFFSFNETIAPPRGYVLVTDLRVDTSAVLRYDELSYFSIGTYGYPVFLWNDILFTWVKNRPPEIHQVRLVASNNTGRTWTDLTTMFGIDMEHRLVSGFGYLFNLSPSELCIHSDSGLLRLQYDSQRFLLDTMPAPADAQILRRVNENVLVGIAYNSGRGAFLRSTDNGLSWTSSDSLMAGNRMIDVVMWNVFHYDTSTALLTLFTQQGDLLSSTDAGKTWIDRGSLGEPYDSAIETTISPSGDAICRLKGAFASTRFSLRTPSPPDSIRHPSANLLVISDSVVLGMTSNNIIRSTNDGKTWAYLHDIDLGNTRWSRDGKLGTKPESTYGVFSTSNGLVALSRTTLRLDADDDSTWYGIPRATFFGLSDLRLSESLVTGRHTGDTISMVSSATSSGANVNATVYSISISDSVRATTRFFSKFRGQSAFNDGFTVVTQDTVYYLDYEGAAVRQSFVTTGLPPLSPVSKLWFVGDNLYAGVRGLRADRDGDISDSLAGGLFRSADSGRTWTRVVMPLDTLVSVDDITSLHDGTLLVLTTRRVVNLVTHTTSESDHVLFRSTDAGATWTEVRRDFYGGPERPSIERLIVTPGGRIIFPAYRRGITWSDDAGTTWSELNDVFFDTMDVYRITLEGEQRLLIATDWGPYIVDLPAITSVDGDEGVPYPHLIVRPNPSQTATTISLLNANRIHGGVRSLHVYNSAGQLVRDLTPNIRGREHLGTVDVDVDISNLPTGIYIVRLSAGTRSQTVNLAVVR